MIILLNIWVLIKFVPVVGMSLFKIDHIRFIVVVIVSVAEATLFVIALHVIKNSKQVINVNIVRMNVIRTLEYGINQKGNALHVIKFLFRKDISKNIAQGRVILIKCIQRMNTIKQKNGKRLGLNFFLLNRIEFARNVIGLLL